MASQMNTAVPAEALALDELAHASPDGLFPPVANDATSARSRSLRAVMASDFVTLRLMVAIVDEGSVSAAAQVCCQSVAAASKRIKEFEHRLDLRLFDRGPRGMLPTGAGTVVADFARTVLALGDELARELEHRRAGGHASIALCANSSALVQYLPGDLTAFAKAHPSVQVRLGERPSGSAVEDLMTARADLGIHDADYTQPGLESRLYRREQIIVLVPPKHPLARRRGKVKLVDVLEHEMVALPPGTAMQSRVTRAAARLGRTPPTRLQAHSFESACHFVATGVGVSVMPAGVADKWVGRNSTVRLELDEPWAERHLHLSWNGHRPLAPATAIFRDFLLARCPS